MAIEWFCYRFICAVQTLWMRFIVNPFWIKGNEISNDATSCSSVSNSNAAPISSVPLNIYSNSFFHMFFSPFLIHDENHFFTVVFISLCNKKYNANRNQEEETGTVFNYPVTQIMKCDVKKKEKETRITHCYWKLKWFSSDFSRVFIFVFIFFFLDCGTFNDASCNK